MDLPAGPKRVVIPPEVPPVVKRRLSLRAILIPVLALAVAVGGIALIKATAGPTPDESAQDLATRVARDVLLVVSGNDEAGLANRRIRAEIAEWTKDSGCQFSGGSAVFGNTRAETEKAARTFMQGAKQDVGANPAFAGRSIGFGYAVVPTDGLVRGERFMAIVAAADCSKPSPPPVPGVGS